MEQCTRDFLIDEDEEEEEDLANQVAAMKASGKVLLDGVEYKVESVTPNSSHCATPPRVCATPPSYSTPPPSYGGTSGYVSALPNSMKTLSHFKCLHTILLFFF